ncbi:MAG: hypothetical protein QM299_14400 [Pseudomonadota bacterium]|jgi:hypothetical protein|nr:hypothetical protein [Pseudomonadota bacterium]HON39215.1 hypothetical protein [Deltaproteobacteria bacterium]
MCWEIIHAALPCSLLIGLHFGKKDEDLEDAGDLGREEAFRAMSPASL